MDEVPFGGNEAEPGSLHLPQLSVTVPTSNTSHEGGGLLCGLEDGEWGPEEFELFVGDMNDRPKPFPFSGLSEDLIPDPNENPDPFETMFSFMNSDNFTTPDCTAVPTDDLDTGPLFTEAMDDDTIPDDPAPLFIGTIDDETIPDDIPFTTSDAASTIAFSEGGDATPNLELPDMISLASNDAADEPSAESPEDGRPLPEQIILPTVERPDDNTAATKNGGLAKKHELPERPPPLQETPPPSETTLPVLEHIGKAMPMTVNQRPSIRVVVKGCTGNPGGDAVLTTFQKYMIGGLACCALSLLALATAIIFCRPSSMLASPSVEPVQHQTSTSVHDELEPEPAPIPPPSTNSSSVSESAADANGPAAEWSSIPPVDMLAIFTYPETWRVMMYGLEIWKR